MAKKPCEDCDGTGTQEKWHYECGMQGCISCNQGMKFERCIECEGEGYIEKGERMKYRERVERAKTVMEMVNGGVNMRQTAIALRIPYAVVRYIVKCNGETKKTGRKQNIDVVERNRKIVHLRQRGLTFQDIGDLFRLSRERVRQIAAG